MIPRIARRAPRAALNVPPFHSSCNAHTFRRFNSTSSFNTPTPPNASIFSKTQRRVGYTMSAAMGGVAFGWWDDQYNDRTVTRNLRTAYHGIVIAIDYKLNFDPDSLESINALHERAAGRLLEVCEKNGGLYVKLAQALATQGPFLPPPYMRLGKLLDDAEHFDYETVRQTVQRELGAPMEDLFLRFDPEPIAAASIAQVHRARIRLPSGEEEEVAVKVQRPDIRRHANWDLWAYRALLRLYGYFFDLPLAFAANYISDQLMQETRFDHEAANSERIRLSILNSPDTIIKETVYVPRIHPHLSTPRILTMEYIADASKLTDLPKIEQMGLSKKKVGRSVAEVFAAQIFDIGFVQADGHPSNVLVRKHPNGTPGQHQIVLIDHGLYISLSPEFRHKYAELWYAIFVVDLPTVKRICASWGIGQAELFASATLLKPWQATSPSSITPASKTKRSEDSESQGETITREEEQTMKEERQLRTMRELKVKLKTFLLDVELVPKELIFIGRAMRILQANNQAMGSPVNRLNILARHASSGLLNHAPNATSLPLQTTQVAQIPSHSSVKEWVHGYILSRISFLRFRTVLFAIDVAFYLTNWTAWLSLTRRRLAERVWGQRGKQSRGRGKFEDALEDRLREMARTNLGVQITEDAFEG